MLMRRNNSSMYGKQLSVNISANSEYFNRIATAEDLESVQAAWQVACSHENIQLHKNVHAEFKKRIKDAGLTGTKAKLDLRNGYMSDRKLMLFILVLSKKPVISKLEIKADEISNEALKAIINILQIQMKFCQELDLDNRLQACLLGEVVLEGRQTNLDRSLVKDLQETCNLLRFVNAQAFIRATYLDDNAAAQSKETIESSYVDKLWTKIVGKHDLNKVLKAYSAAGVIKKDLLTYTELESIIIQGFISRDLLTHVEPRLIEKVTFLPEESSSPSKDKSKDQSINSPHNLDLTERLEIAEKADSNKSIETDDLVFSKTTTGVDVQIAADTELQGEEFVGDTRSSPNVLSPAHPKILINEDKFESIVNNPTVYSVTRGGDATNDDSSIQLSQSDIASAQEGLKGDVASIEKDRLATLITSSDCHVDIVAQSAELSNEFETSAEFVSNLHPSPDHSSFHTAKVEEEATNQLVKSNDMEPKESDSSEALISFKTTPQSPIASKLTEKTEAGTFSSNLTDTSDSKADVRILSEDFADSKNKSTEEHFLSIKKDLDAPPMISLNVEGSAVLREGAFEPVQPPASEISHPSACESSERNLETSLHIKESSGTSQFVNTFKPIPSKVSPPKPVDYSYLLAKPTSSTDSPSLAEKLLAIESLISMPFAPIVSTVASSEPIVYSKGSLTSVSPAGEGDEETKKTAQIESRIQSIDLGEIPPLPASKYDSIVTESNYDSKEARRGMAAIVSTASPPFSSSSAATATSTAAAYKIPASASKASLAHAALTSTTSKTAIMLRKLTTSRSTIYPASSFVVLPLTNDGDVDEEKTEIIEWAGAAALSPSDFVHPKINLKFVKFLCLSNNSISDLKILNLPLDFPQLHELDLSHNNLKGKLAEGELPLTLTKLDLSNNQLTDVMILIQCVDLLELNLAGNHIKNLFGLPSKLTRLDISSNKIYSMGSLRSLAISANLTALNVQGNPIVASIDNAKLFFRSLLRNLMELNGMKLGIEKKKGSKIVDQVAVGSNSSSLGSIPGRPTTPSKISRITQKEHDEKRSKQQKKKLAEAEPIVSTAKVPKITKKDADLLSARLLNGSTHRTRALDSSSKLVPPNQQPKHPLSSRGSRNQAESPIRRSRSASPMSTPSSIRSSGVRSISPIGLNGQESKNRGKSLADVIEAWLTKGDFLLRTITWLYKSSHKFLSPGQCGAADVDEFSVGLEGIKTQADLPEALKKAIKSDLLNDDQLHEVQAIQTKVSKAVQLLQQIYTVSLLSIDGGVEFGRAFEVIMRSPLGEFMNDNILTPYKCQFTSLAELMESSNGTAATATGASSSSHPQTLRLTPIKSDQFEHKFRDYESPSSSSNLSKSMQSFEEDPFNRIRDRVSRKFSQQNTDNEVSSVQLVQTDEAKALASIHARQVLKAEAQVAEIDVGIEAKLGIPRDLPQLRDSPIVNREQPLLHVTEQKPNDTAPAERSSHALRDDPKPIRSKVVQDTPGTSRRGSRESITPQESTAIDDVSALPRPKIGSETTSANSAIDAIIPAVSVGIADVSASANSNISLPTYSESSSAFSVAAETTDNQNLSATDRLKARLSKIRAKSRDPSPVVVLGESEVKATTSQPAEVSEDSKVAMNMKGEASSMASLALSVSAELTDDQNLSAVERLNARLSKISPKSTDSAPVDLAAANEINATSPPQAKANEGSNFMISMRRKSSGALSSSPETKNSSNPSASTATISETSAPLDSSSNNASESSSAPVADAVQGTADTSKPTEPLSARDRLRARMNSVRQNSSD